MDYKHAERQGVTRFLDPKTGLNIGNLFSAEGRQKEITKAGLNLGALVGDVVSGAGSVELHLIF